MSLRDWELNKVDELLQRDLHKKKKTLHNNIVLCKKVKRFLDKNEVWKELIAPMIDKMIGDIVGYKRGNLWSAGSLSKARKEERREYYIGYKQFGIDLNNRLYNYVTQLERCEKLLKAIDEKDRKKDKPGRPYEFSTYEEKDILPGK